MEVFCRHHRRDRSRGRSDRYGSRWRVRYLALCRLLRDLRLRVNFAFDGFVNEAKEHQRKRQDHHEQFRSHRQFAFDRCMHRR